MTSSLPRCRVLRPAVTRRLALAWALAVAALPAAAFDVVSHDEAARDRAAPEPMLSRALPVPGAPTIEVVSPDLQRALSGPVDIVLRWRAGDGASIDPSSFKVLYGRLRLDVTQRLAKYAKVSADGLEAPNAALPPGSHRLVVQITDSLKRTSQHEMRIEVAEKPSS